MTRSRLVIGELAVAARTPLAARRGHCRRRPLRLLLLGTAILALAAGLGIGVRWLLTAPTFAIARVEAGPYRFTEPARLESSLQTALHQNIWSYRTGGLTGKLGCLPWIRTATVERRLPATLRLHLQEWRPLLIVATGSGQRAGLPRPADQEKRGAAGTQGSPWVMLENGEIVRFPADLPPPALPVLLGCELAPVAGSEAFRLAGGRAEAVLQLLAAISRTGLESAAPVDFVIAREDGFELRLRQEGVRLLVGHDAFAERLQRYLATRGELAAGGTVDLRFQGRVIVVDNV
jgi:hypothetical protein